MNKPQISLQTFTIRKYLKTPAAMESSLKRVKAAGINALELARIDFTPKVIALAAGICRDNEINVLSTQIKLKTIEKNISWSVKLHRMLDCSNCCVSVIDLAALKSVDSLRAYAQRINNLGLVMKEEGINLLFHHHNFEFVPLGDTTGFKLLKEYLDPQFVGFVLDTYWLQRSGYKPADVIISMKGRVGGIHLRDFRLKPPVLSPGITDTELGRGSIDFSKVSEAAAEAGCKYMAIEQATADPWGSLDTSIEHLRAIGLDSQL